MDTIFLHGLKVECVIGVWDWERRIKQQVEIDIDMAADIRGAAATDQLEDTLNYKAIAKAVISHVENSQYQLGGKPGGEHCRNSDRGVQNSLVPGESSTREVR